MRPNLGIVPVIGEEHGTDMLSVGLVEEARGDDLALVSMLADRDVGNDQLAAGRSPRRSRPRAAFGRSTGHGF